MLCAFPPPDRPFHFSPCARTDHSPSTYAAARTPQLQHRGRTFYRSHYKPGSSSSYPASIPCTFTIDCYRDCRLCGYSAHRLALTTNGNRYRSSPAPFPSLLSSCQTTTIGSYASTAHARPECLFCPATTTSVRTIPLRSKRRHVKFRFYDSVTGAFGPEPRI